MIKTEQISIASIEPSGVNPRQDFGDIATLAKSFTTNLERPGEPVNPPLVVRDGSAYRIVDGERRYRAMLETGTEICTVNVCDSLDEANQILGMLATDDKKHLSELEKSIGVQQVLLLGVEPDVLASAINRTTEEIERARAGAQVLAKKKRKKPKTHTLDRLIAIAELQEAGLNKSVTAVEKASDEDWRFIAFEAKCQVEFDKERAEFTKILVKEDVTILKENPSWSTYKYLCGHIESKSELKKALRKHKKDHPDLLAYIREGGCNKRWNAKPDAEPGSKTSTRCSLYAPHKDKGKSTDKQSSDKKRANKLKRQFKEARERRGQFVAQRIGSWETNLINTSEFVMKHLDYRFVGIVRAFNDRYGASVEWKPSAAMIAYTFACNENINDSYPDILGIIQKESSNYRSGCPQGAAEYVSLLCALKADGYEPDEGELELHDLAVECLAHFDNKGKSDGAE